MKKILLVLLGSFMLLSTITFGCPNKKLHNSVKDYLSVSKAVHVEGKRLFIVNKALGREAMYSSNGDEKEAKKTIEAILELLHEYSKAHGLEMILLNDIKGWNK